MNRPKPIPLLLAVFIAFGFLAAMSWAGETVVPPSTNPANHPIFPAKGQGAEQQMKDQLAAYNWATKETGWDPYKAYDQMVAKGHAAEMTAEQAKGGLVGGAARGALVGVAVGAIAGDAGKGAAIGAAAGGLAGGMRSRRQQRGAEAEKEQAIQAFKSQFAKWDKYYQTAMEGRGYTIR
jgi:hypothetical protein